MARKKQPAPNVPADPGKQKAARLLSDSEAPDPFDDAAQQRFGKLIAAFAAKPIGRHKRSASRRTVKRG
jgi:hypothetical protein